MMSKKNKADKNGFVYSTDPQFSFEEESSQVDTLLPAQQMLKIKLDTKQRGGKVVTLIDGFVGTESDLSDLGKALKSHCGTGGSAKDGQMLVQGDHREKIRKWLHDRGYTKAKLI
jgi:translation initiation factor 1